MLQVVCTKKKRLSLFSSSAESASACGAQKYSCHSLHWRTLGITEFNHQTSRTGKMGRDLRCWMNSTKVSHSGCPHRISNWAWCDRPQGSEGKAMPAADSALYRGGSLPPAPWVLLEPGALQTAQRVGGKQYVPSLNVEGPLLRG